MKKIISVVLVVIAIFSFMTTAEAANRDEHIPNAKGTIDGRQYLEKIMADKGMPKIKNGYLARRIATPADIETVLSWLFNKEVVFPADEEVNKESLVKLLSVLTSLKEHQIESILLKKLPLERLTVKELNYCVLCLIEHPLTAKKVNSLLLSDVKIYETITIEERELYDAILDMEMLEWFVPTYICVLGPENFCKTLSRYLNEESGYSRQNCKTINELHNGVVTVGYMYTGAWLHIVAMRSDTSIFDLDYEHKINLLWKQFEEEKGVTGNITFDIISINSFIGEKLEYSHWKYDQTMKGAIIGQKAVCSGYADTFKFLANLSGIDCVLAINDAEEHEWVQYRYENVWYNADPTWDDLGIASSNMYLGKTDDLFKELKHPLMNNFF